MREIYIKFSNYHKLFCKDLLSGLQMSIPTKEQIFFVPLSGPSWKSSHSGCLFKPYAVAKGTLSAPCLCCLGFKGEAQFTPSLTLCLPVAGNSIRHVFKKKSPWLRVSARPHCCRAAGRRGCVDVLRCSLCHLYLAVCCLMKYLKVVPGKSKQCLWWYFFLFFAAFLILAAKHG